MTVSKALIDFIKQYDGTITTIDTDQIKGEPDKFGIYRGAERILKSYNDEDYLITEYFNLFIRRDSQIETDRQDNDEWLENFAYWIDDKEYEGDYPILDNNREVQSLALTGSPYAFQTENKETIYMMIISITYLRMRQED